VRRSRPIVHTGAHRLARRAALTRSRRCDWARSDGHAKLMDVDNNLDPSPIGIQTRILRYGSICAAGTRGSACSSDVHRLATCCCGPRPKSQGSWTWSAWPAAWASGPCDASFNVCSGSKLGSRSAKMACPFYSQQQTSSGHRGMSGSCQLRTHAAQQMSAVRSTSSRATPRTGVIWIPHRP
jgi:hypothetical protein